MQDQHIQEVVVGKFDKVELASIYVEQYNVMVIFMIPEVKGRTVKHSKDMFNTTF